MSESASRHLKCASCQRITLVTGEWSPWHLCDACGHRGPLFGYPDLVSERLFSSIEYFHALGKKSLGDYVAAFASANKQNLGCTLELQDLRLARQMVAAVFGGSQLDVVAHANLRDELLRRFGLKEGAIVDSFIFRLCSFNESMPEHSTVVLHTAALIEHMLWSMSVDLRMRIHREPRPTAEKRVSKGGWGGLRAKLEYMGDILGEKVESVLGRTSDPKWYEDCGAVAKKRNDYLHDARCEILIDDAEQAFMVANRATPVLAAVWNEQLRVPKA